MQLESTKSSILDKSTDLECEIDKIYMSALGNAITTHKSNNNSIIIDKNIIAK